MKQASKQIVAVTLNPCLDTAFFVDGLNVGQSNQVLRVERDAGGNGINVSRVVRKLGGRAIATGFLGGGIGAHLVAILDNESVCHDFIHIKGETRVSIMIEPGDGSPTVLAGLGPFVKTIDVVALMDELELLLPDSGWLTLGGSLPPGLQADVYASLVPLGRKHGCKVLLDADVPSMSYGMDALPDLIKPNVSEAERLLGRTIGSQKEKIEAAKELRDEMKGRSGLLSTIYEPTVIISDGERNAVMACAEGIYLGEPPKVNARSTIGSGDSMLGAFVWESIMGKSNAECFQWGLAAGAATATTNGAEICSRSMILQLLEGAHVSHCHPVNA